MSNLAESLQDEIKRNYELKALYDSIPEGIFGSAMIQTDLDAAHQSIKDGDVVQMLVVYERLKSNE